MNRNDEYLEIGCGEGFYIRNFAPKIAATGHRYLDVTRRTAKRNRSLKLISVIIVDIVHCGEFNLVCDNVYVAEFEWGEN